MNWMDIASIVFVCVTANHLGLVKAIEDTVDKELPVINCVKCFSFWSVLTYCCVCRYAITDALAVSFLASYSALWLELLEAYIDKLYMKLYDKIYENPDDTAAASPDKGHSAGSVP